MSGVPIEDPLASSPARYHTDVGVRIESTNLSQGSPAARSLLGMMKPELGVSDSQRKSVFAQWILGLPLEAIESSSLKDLYLDDHQPGAARFRIRNGDEGSSGEFLNWLTEFNGAPLKRGASRLVIPLNTQVFIQGATRAANP
ncbi:hypothetical protein OAD85_00230 [Actinomycetota bacterium]|nr:hypothetical protein [Actinomycetota bacterium]